MATRILYTPTAHGATPLEHSETTNGPSRRTATGPALQQRPDSQQASERGCGRRNTLTLRGRRAGGSGIDGVKPSGLRTHDFAASVISDAGRER